MTATNRQWILVSRPQGMVKPDNLEYREVPAPTGELMPGEIVLRNLVFLCAPTIRNWMNAQGNNYYPSIPLGAPVMGPTAAQVIKSANPEFPVGRCVFNLTGWQDYAIINPSLPFVPAVVYPEGVSPVDTVGVYGINSLTAYFGLLKVGEPKPGETLVVSAAAGSTGSVAAQIGKIKGCRVIGIAGGRQKCDWLRDVCRLDATVDYKSEPVSARLRELCPNGIDIYFDNVGADILQAAIDNIAIHGRIVLCGQISGYNGDEKVPGPSDMMRLIYGRVKMQGFLGSDYPDERSAAIAELMRWVRQGKLAHREDIREGFENLPKVYGDLFTGANNGTLLVKVGDLAGIPA